MTANNYEQHIPVEELSTYADGEIWDPADLERIEQHLAVCEACQEELAELQALSLMLAELPEPELPRSFRLTEADVAPTQAPETIQPWIIRHQALFRYAGLAAVVLMALVITVDLLPGTGTDDTDDVTVTTFMDESPDMAEPEAEDPDGEAGIMVADDDQPVTESEAAEEDLALDEEETASDESVADEDRIEDSELEQEMPEEDAATEERTSADGEEQAPLMESAPEDDDETDVTPFAVEETDDGLNALRIAAIALGVLSIVLLMIGFVLPRWSSTAQ